jgi:intein/homing endonuclease
VKVGDRVLAADASGKVSFADVIAVPHPKNSIVAYVIEVTTSSGRSLKMTPDHMIIAGSCGGPMRVVRADNVLVGSCVSTVEGSEVVSSTSLQSSSGLYTIVTTEEFLVVNGIVASPYAQSHSAGHSLYFVHRLVYSLSPSLLMNKLFNVAYQSVSAFFMSW